MFIRKLYKNGQVSIPKEITKQLEINEGTILFVDYQEGNIVIDKKNDNSSLNQRTLSNGVINIPKEIRDIHGIGSDRYLLIKADQQSTRILLRPENKRKK